MSLAITVGPVTDYLLGQARAAVTGVLVDGKPFLVVDGWPTELQNAMFYVGLSKPPNPPVEMGEGEATGTRSWASLGAGKVDEEYTVPHCIDVRLGGTQKQARDTAETVFNGYWTLLATDLSLGGLLAQSGRVEITDLTSTPGNVGTAAEPGKRQTLSFGVHVVNRLSR